MIATADENSTRRYGFVFAALMALTALTAGAAFVDLGGLNMAAALAIAASKATLIAMVFMQASRGSRLVRLTIVAAGVWLAIILGLTLSDFLTRSW
jgi:cytochrome c oxidase subunit 4